MEMTSGRGHGNVEWAWAWQCWAGVDVCLTTISERGLKCERHIHGQSVQPKTIRRDSTWAWGGLGLDDTESEPGLIFGVGNMSIWCD